MIESRIARVFCNEWPAREYATVPCEEVCLEASNHLGRESLFAKDTHPNFLPQPRLRKSEESYHFREGNGIYLLTILWN